MSPTPPPSENHEYPSGSDKKELDYTTRRKVIYKGKMAPQGSVYLVVTVKSKSKKFESWCIVKGMAPEDEQKMFVALRQRIKDNHHI